MALCMQSVHDLGSLQNTWKSTSTLTEIISIGKENKSFTAELPHG